MIAPERTVVIAEDQTLVREGLKSLIKTESHLNVIAEAEDGLGAIRAVAKHQPDLVIVDLAMPKMNGISAIKEIKRQASGTKILALTFHTSDEYILAAFDAGADGYCLKNDSHAELMAAIRSVLDDKKYLSPAISEKVLEGFLTGRERLKKETSWQTLTQREKEVLQLVSEGYTSAQIAEYLFISPKTVDKHRSNLMKKLDLHSASALTAYAIEKGLARRSAG